MKNSVGQHSNCRRISRKVKRYLFLSVIAVTSIALLVFIGKKNLVYGSLFKNDVLYFDETVYDDEPGKHNHAVTSMREQVWATNDQQGLVQSNAQTMSPNYNVRGRYADNVKGSDIEGVFVMADNEQSNTQDNDHKYDVPKDDFVVPNDVFNVPNTWKEESFDIDKTNNRLDSHQIRDETDTLRKQIRINGLQDSGETKKIETDITDKGENEKIDVDRHVALAFKHEPVNIQNQNSIGNVVGKIRQIKHDVNGDSNMDRMVNNLLEQSDTVNLETIQGTKNTHETLVNHGSKNTQKTQNTQKIQNSKETEHAQVKENTHETHDIQGTHNNYETQNSPEETINILNKANKTQSNANQKQSKADRIRDNFDTRKDPEKRRDMNKGGSHTPVLLLTYLRSGSTLTADIIQQVPGVFYSYEPLKPYFISRTIKRPEELGYLTMDGICSISNSSCRPPSQISEQKQVIVADIVRFYSCDLTHFNRSFMWSRNGKAVAQYHMCMKTSARLKTRKDLCLKQCFDSSKSIKTIRLSMDMVETLLQKVTNLKVIHLLRDPRGMIQSRKRGGFVKPSMNLTTVARAVCQRFERDIEISIILKKKYPGRLKTYLYEQIAEHPKSASDSLFNFLGLTASANFNMWLHNHTSAGNRSSFYGTSRPNSTITASAWRLKLPYTEVIKIDNECTKYYKYTGILTADSAETLKNLNFQLRSKSPLFGDFL